MLRLILKTSGKGESRIKFSNYKPTIIFNHFFLSWQVFINNLSQMVWNTHFKSTNRISANCVKFVSLPSNAEWYPIKCIPLPRPNSPFNDTTFTFAISKDPLIQICTKCNGFFLGWFHTLQYFMDMSSFYVILQTNKQTKQAENITSLAEAITLVIKKNKGLKITRMKQSVSGLICCIIHLRHVPE